MIVRDVVLSSEPRALRPVARAAVPTSAPPPPSAPPAPVLASASPPVSSASNPPAPASPPKPVLTTETVISWLATQPADIRTAVARSLATEIDTLREQGRAQGAESGRAQALQEVSRRAESSLVALAAVATAAEAAFSLEATALTHSCADIVSEAFLKIAGQHLASREAVVGAVVEVVKRIKESREVTVRVSSQDLTLLREYEQSVRDALGSRQFTLVGDSRVSVGGCLVDSDLGTLDGRLEVQLRELFETIRAAKAVGT